MKRFFILLVCLLLTGSSVQASEQTRANGLSKLWASYEEAANNRMPQSAMQTLSKIYKSAAAQNAKDDMIKSKFHMIVLQMSNQLEGADTDGNPHSAFYNKFLSEIESSDKEIQPVMKLMLAKWLWAYYSNNSYRFEARTATANLDDNDFTTWDLPKLTRKVSELYQNVFSNEKLLKSISIKEINSIIEKGNVSDSLRPTLFDFFVYEALEFYTNEAQNTVKPIQAYEIDSNSPALASYNDFEKWNLHAEDQNSSVIQAAILFQKLLAFNLEKGNTPGFIDNEINRLKWAKDAAVGEGVTERFVKSLQSLVNKYPTEEETAIALAEMSLALKEEDKNTEALEYAEKAIKDFPGTKGAEEAQSVKDRILAKTVSFKSEKVLQIKTKSNLEVSSKNVDKLYFRLIARNESELTNDDVHDPDSIDYDAYDTIISRDPVKTWTTKLSDTVNYKEHTELVELPSLEKGFYYLCASVKPDFSWKSNTIFITPITVSNLGFIARRWNGKNEIITVNSKSGAPIQNADIQVLAKDYNKGWTEIYHGKTDKDGRYSFGNIQRGNGLFIIKHNGDSVYDSGYLKSYAFGEERPIRRIQLFTDRAIYRPGQTVYFKGIAYSSDKEQNEYNTIENCGTDVTLIDPHGSRIKTESFRTNKFGSFSGSFIAPVNQPTGRYRIEARSKGKYSCSGFASVQIEEYKRPKFKVTLNAPESEYKLGEKVVLNGLAMGYNGSAASNAKVTYRVVRQTKWALRWWWLPRMEDAAEIAHGTATTDSTGKFQIEFTAKPDLSADKNYEPEFSYEITANVTDINGETRSASEYVNIGYKSAKIIVEADNEIAAGSSFKVSTILKTLNDKPLKKSGKIEVISLKQPSVPFRKSYFNSEEVLKQDMSDPRNWAKDSVKKVYNFSAAEDGTSQTIIDGLPEGVYCLKATSSDKDGNEIVDESIVMSIDNESNNFGIKIPFYSRTKAENLQPGDVYKAVWATGYEEGPAYVEVTHRKQILASYWTSKNSNKAEIKIPVTESMRGGFNITITQFKNGRTYKANEYVSVPWDNKKLDVKFSKMRSKLEPGSKETWKIEIAGQEAERESIELAAAMYDSALDAYAKQSWPASFNTFYTDVRFITSELSNGAVFASQPHNDLNNFTYPEARIYPKLAIELPFDFAYRRMRSLGRGARGIMFSKNACVQEDCLVQSSAPMAMKSLSARPAVKAYNGVPSVDSAAEEEGNTSVASGDLDKVALRTNLQETAFFYPNLLMNESGSVTVEFQVPDALTTWKFMAFAHGTKLQSGYLEKEILSQKDLMIEPNAPRFFREGDRIIVTAKVSNLTDKIQKGKARLTFVDPITDEVLNKNFGLKDTVSFRVPAGESKAVEWVCHVPDKAGLLKYKVVASTGKYTDGEEGWIPVLSRFVYVTESLPMPINGPAVKEFFFKKLADSEKSNSLKHKSVTLEVTSNPSWYAVQALPYLNEAPYETSINVFNRYYANALASHIANADPKIRKVFEVWRRNEQFGGKALLSNLEKNPQLKSAALEETPWVLEAENETAQKHKIAELFNEDSLNSQLSNALTKLGKMQAQDGSFPWISGGTENPFITLYIMTGFGRLNALGVKTDMGLAVKSIAYVDNEIVKQYKEIKKHKNYLTDNYMSPIYALYLYGRSFFISQHPISGRTQKAFQYFIDQAEKFWPQLPRMSQAHIAIALNRIRKTNKAETILKSLKERSTLSEENGRYWKDHELSISWFKADIETQSMMIEAFTEIADDVKTADECRLWLIKQKQTQNWKSSKATADAVYALLLQGTDLLGSNKLVTATIGSTKIVPNLAEAGTGYYQKIFHRSEIKSSMAKTVLEKTDKGPAWGAIHWQYFEDLSKVTSHNTQLSLTKNLFIKSYTDNGPVITKIENGNVKVGDLVTVRIVLKTDRDLEYVHMKDGRGSGLEPVNVLSNWKYQDGLSYYEATKDISTSFFFDYLPKGTYVFEYDLRVQHAGNYQSGTAEIQCMYAPEFNSHSDSQLLNAER